MRRACLAIAVVCLAAPALAQPNGSLVKATLTHVEDVSEMPNALRICVDADCQIIIDGSFRITYTVNRLLAGPKTTSTVSWMQASARPRKGRRYYLVIEPSETGPKIVWTGSLRNGVCIDLAEAERLGLRAEIGRFPCRAD